MTRKNLLRTFIIGPLVSLSLFTTFASAAQAQSYDDDGNRILTPTEVYAALTKIEQIENTMRTYATVGVDADALINAPNAFDLTPGHRPDLVELFKSSDPSNPSNAQTTLLRVREGDDFHSEEEWNITTVKGKDGQIHRHAKLDLKQSMFNDLSFEDFLKQNNPKAFAAAYKAGKTSEVTEDEPFTIASRYYINDLMKVDPSRAGVAFVVAKGITPDDRGAAVQRSVVASYYNHACADSAVTSSPFAPSSEFAAKARGYSFSCKNGIVQGAPDGSLRIWFPGDEKPANPARPQTSGKPVARGHTP